MFRLVKWLPALGSMFILLCAGGCSEKTTTSKTEPTTKIMKSHPDGSVPKTDVTAG